MGLQAWIEEGALRAGFDRDDPLVELNATAALVLAACDGKTSVAQIACDLRVRFPEAPSTLRLDVARAVRTLRRAGCLTLGA